MHSPPLKQLKKQILKTRITITNPPKGLSRKYLALWPIQLGTLVHVSSSFSLLLSPLPRRDGYRSMATFLAHNQECLSCARRKPCTQPSLPCNGSMVSMSQGRWMSRPKSEYAHVPQASSCQPLTAGPHTHTTTHIHLQQAADVTLMQMVHSCI